MTGPEETPWRFAARTKEGRPVAGTMRAASEEEALARLRARQLTPVSVDAIRAPRAFGIGRRVDPRSLSVMTRQLATLIDAGLPLLAAIEMLSDLTHDRVLRKALKAVSRDLYGGSSLSDALRVHPHVFPHIYVSMVEAGEVGGSLPESLERVSAYMEAAQELRDRISGALIYPGVVLATAALAVGVILAFVVPVFRELFAAEGLVLPFGTQVLLAVSDFTVSWWPFMLGGLVAAPFVIRQLLSVPSVRRGADVVLNGLPMVGLLARKAAVSRLTGALASMVQSGVILPDALLAAARISGNSEVEAAVLEARTAVMGGSDLSSPLARSRVLPELLPQMVKVGEESGRLGEMLEKVAELFEMEVKTAIDGAMKALEPALIVVLGVVLGGIIVTMYIPIFDLMTSLG